MRSEAMRSDERHGRRSTFRPRESGPAATADPAGSPAPTAGSSRHFHRQVGSRIAPARRASVDGTSASRRRDEDGPHTRRDVILGVSGFSGV